jgi:Holliday junction resolvase-like predicted endonuclease
MSEKLGKINEEKAVEYFRKQGYQVLNVNKKGFPDLIILKGKEIQFFVEVKGGRHKIHPWQRHVHNELEKMGFQVKPFFVETSK